MKKNTFHEIVAGLSTFFAIAYLFALSPQLLSLSGVDFGSALTATILAITFATLFFALYVNGPIAVGPGLSVMTYLVFSVIGKQTLSWPEALGLVFWAGLLQTLLSVFGLRQKILLATPKTLQHAAAAGLGLFFIAIGLKQLDIVEITNGSYSMGIIGGSGQAIALIGLTLFALLHWLRFPGSCLIPVIFCWVAGLYLGETKWQGLFSLPPSLEPTFFKLSLKSILEPRYWSVLLTILLISIFDAGATLTALARQMGWLREDGSIRNVNRAVIPDGVGSILSALLGTTSCSFYAESSIGIHAKGRTWAAGCTVSICCLSALFLYPALSSIPLFATAPVILGIGGLLARNLRWIDWKKKAEALSFLIASFAMPLFFSIYWGFALGFISYTLLKTLTGKTKEIHPFVWGLSAIFGAHLLYIVTHPL